MKKNKNIVRVNNTTDLEYLSSLAFESFSVTNDDLKSLSNKIDLQVKPNSGNLYSIFISGLIGLLIGISVFFIVFNKQKNHMSFPAQQTDGFKENSLHNSVMKTDTIFPQINYVLKTEVKEHFKSIENNEIELKQTEIAEVLESKKSSILTNDASENTDILFEFAPNAPVIFINNLKVTNYRSYYFKRNESVNLLETTGLSAQYESRNGLSIQHENYTNPQQSISSKSNSYLAHKIIQNAMYLYSTKQLTNCMEELTILYNFNSTDANAQFYLGMCYFELGKYKYALNFFTKNTDNENNIFHQESNYYQALCYLKTNQKDKAISQLNNIIKSKGFYSKRADETLKKLELFN